MMLGLILLFALYEDWRARRELAEHVRVTCSVQVATAELAMQFQREEFESLRANKQRS